MKPEDIRQTVETIITNELGWEDSIPDGDLSEHLDSIQRFSLVVAIEDHYEICFEPEEGEQISTFEQVISLVQTKVLAK